MLSIPLIPLQRIFQWTPLTCLFAVRCTLWLYVFSSILLLERTVSCRFGKAVGNWFLVITCTEFHLLFYGSRLLPNIFALVWTNISFSLILEQRHIPLSFFILAFTCVVFRSEIILLGAVVFLVLVAIQILSCPPHHKKNLEALLLFVWNILRYGIFGAIFGTVLSIVVDSIFWSRLCFPEWEAFHFNAIRGLSKHWGTSPPSWYMTHALPKLLMGGGLGGLSIGWLADRRTWPLYIISFGYVLLYSCLSHKEVRFIFYVVPLWNICAAVGFEYLRKRRNKHRLVGALMFGGLCFLLIGNFIFSLFWVWISSHNYPGADALQTLHQIVAGEENGMSKKVYIHIDPAAAMTGISRYLQRLEETFSYSRQENIEDLFDYLITEKPWVENFTMIRSIIAFSKMDWKHLQPIWEPKIFIHTRQS